jgi:thioredoxin 1
MALELTDYTFDATIKSDTITVVDFWASWCAPCRMMAPIIDELSKEYAGKVVIAKVDVDAYVELATRFGIRSIPAILFFKNGKEIGREVGACSKGTLLDKIETVIATV